MKVLACADILHVRTPATSWYALIAQLVEHRTFNPLVAGSSPAGGTTQRKDPMKAITITQKNKSTIAADYLISNDDMEDLLPTGWILLADFGTPWYEGVITQAFFDTYFTKGDALENEYFDVIKK